MNGSKVDNFRTINNEKSILCNDYNLDDSVIEYKEKDIKSIVTKEQFSSLEYII